MAEYLIQSETLDDIADAINQKAGSQGTMTPAQMVTAIEAIPTGGGGVAYELHSIQITLASSTTMLDILRQYINECSSWRIYPTDAENTSLNTIAIGTAYKRNSSSLSPDIMADATSATGVTVGSNIGQFYVNDQTYTSLRSRASVSSKTSGSYQLDFYGVAL